MIVKQGTEIFDKEGNLVVTVARDIDTSIDGIPHSEDFFLPDGTHPEIGSVVPLAVLEFFWDLDDD